MYTLRHQAATEFHGIVIDTIDNHRVAVALEPELQPSQGGGAQGGDGGAGGGVEGHQMHQPEQDQRDPIVENGSGADFGKVGDTGIHPADIQNRADHLLHRVVQDTGKADAIQHKSSCRRKQRAEADELFGEFRLRRKGQNHCAEHQYREQNNSSSHRRHLPVCNIIPYFAPVEKWNVSFYFTICHF